MNRQQLFLLLIALGGGANALAAQSRLHLNGMAGATVLGTRADPKPDGGRVEEIRVVAPMFVGAASLGKFSGTATINLESVTIRNGVLNAGAWGEGFVDRRHPHTTVHELVIAGKDLLGSLDRSGSLGLVIGKGFVPFGSDDPMNRPFTTYPVNHHWAQILERAVATVQYRVGAFTAEGTLFNGDEPEHPGQWPLIKRFDGHWRFTDSRAVRVTFAPSAELEVQGSLASVHSPEFRPGVAGDAKKASVSARFQQQTANGERYLMAEWARNSELDGFFVFQSYLIEGMMRRERVSVSYRFEATERPEEEHLINDVYRSLRPHLENSILGIGRWTLHTVRIGADLKSPDSRVQIQPFVEVTAGRVKKVGGGVFDPDFTYSGGGISQLNLGVTLGWGMRGHRMGRYGLMAEGMKHEMAEMKMPME